MEELEKQRKGKENVVTKEIIMEEGQPNGYFSKVRIAWFILGSIKLVEENTNIQL